MHVRATTVKQTQAATNARPYPQLKSFLTSHLIPSNFLLSPTFSAQTHGSSPILLLSHSSLSYSCTHTGGAWQSLVGIVVHKFPYPRACQSSKP
ncbi:hypothetical protein XELAEV_18014559mg [Xenopus laevis]|uniref:Uncharacterized protein n=1 Tax=Xenopus laevis TaxID=8355 RepID=A0A974HVD5_XENLA|nr:hypothetical protein XELAEV_18014559mg [Xenopus laevis]